MPNTSSRLPPFAAKPRPVATQSVRSSSGHAVAAIHHAEIKQVGIKQAGPKPRYVPAEPPTEAL